MNKKYPCCRTLPLYRHKELYEWSDEYQKRKFFSEKDFDAEERLYYLKTDGELDYERAEDSAKTGAYLRFEYRDRYSTLRQDTTFTKNLFKIESIRNKSVSYADFILKCAVRGISERKANFVILYCWLCPGRIFMYDWKRVREKPRRRSYEYSDYENWLRLNEMRKDAFAGRKHNCSKYEEFIEREL